MGQPILIIDNYDSFTFNLAVQFKRLAGSENEILVRRNNQILLEEAEHLTPRAIIFSPGPGTPHETGVCRDLLRSLKPSVPILGVCLGHQLIGEYFGAKWRRAKTVLHGKTSLIRHSATDIFSGLPSPLRVARYHSLVLENLPSDLKLLASDLAQGEIMALRHAQKPIWGVQFHPESFLTQDGDRIIINFLAHCL